jgi:hypothetical protein
MIECFCFTTSNRGKPSSGWQYALVARVKGGAEQKDRSDSANYLREVLSLVWAEWATKER